MQPVVEVEEVDWGSWGSLWPEHGELLSLFDLALIMKTFPINDALTIIGNLQASAASLDHQERHLRFGVTHVNWMKDALKHLRGLREHCEAGELENTLVLLDEFIPKITNPQRWPNFGEMRDGLVEIVRRFIHETKNRKFLYLPRRSADYYEKSQLFGAAVADGFHSAADDIAEAGKCIALDRSTAAVFHLMRVLEVAIKATAASLGLADPVKEADRNWGKMLGDKDLPVGIWAELDKRKKQKDPAWTRELAEFYQAVHTDLCAIRTAWRNPVMHVEGTYTEERALHIFNLVKGFMQHLAERVSEV